MSDERIATTILENSRYVVGNNNSAYMIVTDEQDRQLRIVQVSKAIQSMLPDLLANSATRSLETASEKTAQTYNASDSWFELDGISSITSILQSEGKMLNDGRIDWQSVVGKSSLSTALFPESGGYSPATVWEVGDHRNLSGGGQFNQETWKGDVLTG